MELRPLLGKDGSDVRRFFVVATMVVLVLNSGAAQDTAEVDIGVAQHSDHGTYLVDSLGTALYLFANDSDGSSACRDACADNWPPLVIEGEPMAGAGVAASLLSAIEREDGTQQVTYGGHPLYRYAGDAAPGDVTGHGLNDVWFLVSPYGTAIEAPDEPEQEDAGSGSDTGDGMDPMARANMMGRGRTVYAEHCAACHGAEGEGVSAPALADNARLGNAQRVLAQVIRGGSHMPGFGGMLDDDQIAAVVNYVRNNWGNSHALISPEEVSDER